MRNKRQGFDPWFVKTPCRRKQQPTLYSYWEIPWTEEPGHLQSTGSQRVGHDWAHLLHLWWLFFFTLSSIVCTSQRLHFVLNTILIYLYYYFIAWNFPLSYKIPLPPFLLSGFFQNTLPWFETTAWCLWVGEWVGEV